VLQHLIETGAMSAGEVARRIAFGEVHDPEIVDEGPTRIRLASGSAGGLPGRPAVATLLGRRDLVLVDPGDPSDAAIAAIHDAVRARGGTLHSVVLTATDPDHAAGAEAIAIPLELPIQVAPGAGRHLPYATIELADGERLAADVDLRVRLGPAGSGRLAIDEPSAGQ
jgi:glyoxylase-like metal-dependent hydrolase (beta-lactamase superfamily II)